MTNQRYVVAGTARPTAAYDATWGQEGSWTANDFVPIVIEAWRQGPGILSKPDP